MLKVVLVFAILKAFFSEGKFVVRVCGSEECGQTEGRLQESHRPAGIVQLHVLHLLLQWD